MSWVIISRATSGVLVHAATLAQKLSSHRVASHFSFFVL